MDGHPSIVLIIRMVITVKTVIIIALSYDHYDDDDDAGDMKMRTINDLVNDNTFTSQWSGGFFIRF